VCRKGPLLERVQISLARVAPADRNRSRRPPRPRIIMCITPEMIASIDVCPLRMCRMRGRIIFPACGGVLVGSVCVGLLGIPASNSGASVRAGVVGLPDAR
jgi:hypothetical protein